MAGKKQTVSRHGLTLSPVLIRLTPDTKRLGEQRAKELGMSFAAYVEHLIKAVARP